MTDVFDDLDKLRPRPPSPSGEAQIVELKPRQKPARMPRMVEPFARVPLSWLLDPQKGADLSAKLRLHLFLLIETREGRRPVTLTNALAARIGISRQEKAICLRQLEKDGSLSVVRNGRLSPVVAMKPSR
jgi:hypothetical protein